MPLYESEILSREELYEHRKNNVCAECGGWLNVFYDLDAGRFFLACNDWHRTHHEGVMREPTEYEKGGLAALNIPRRREIMQERYGEENTRKLAKYTGAAIVTREMATEIVETLWRGAPPVQKTKAILLCATYGLNPLMNHLFMLPFKNKKTGKVDWVVVMGIEATRLLARRCHNYSYLDLTPRRATREELEKILGDHVNAKRLYFITKIRDIDTQAEAYGLGWWEGSAYGEDKGNSPSNMASIRSERQCLKRLYPAEIPSGVEAVDERFAEATEDDAIVGDFTEVDDSTPDETPGVAAASGDSAGAEEVTADPATKTAEETLDDATEGDNATPASAPPAKPARRTSAEIKPEDVPDGYALEKVANEVWGMQPAELWPELNYNSVRNFEEARVEKAWDCFLKLKAIRG
jgi:hypothetical protein